MSQGQNYVDVCVDVWGEFAMFTRPESKVERTTYLVPTPSACRGILNAIYSKPVEFYYEIRQIEIMNQPRLLTLRRNEVNAKADVSKCTKVFDYHLMRDDMNTQRMCTYLRDVYYRIHARMILQKDKMGQIDVRALQSQFRRRVSGGKCFYQPVLGCRECMCYFSLPDMTKKPCSWTESLGLMLYDVFDITKHDPLDTRSAAQKKGCGETMVSFFDAQIVDGVMQVPPFDSNEILVRRNQ